jgi:hypothetical protein
MRDNIAWIASNMAWEKRLERRSRIGFRVWPDRHSALMPISEGDIELEFSDLGRCDTFVNISEDRGIYEELNEPEIFGYYRYTDDGMYMTLEECSAHIGPDLSFDYERHTMKSIDFSVWR